MTVCHCGVPSARSDGVWPSWTCINRHQKPGFGSVFFFIREAGRHTFTETPLDETGHAVILDLASHPSLSRRRLSPAGKLNWRATGRGLRLPPPRAVPLGFAGCRRWKTPDAVGGEAAVKRGLGWGGPGGPA